MTMKMHLHQRFALKDYDSLVDNLQKSDDQYGQCQKHGKRVFEFYCFDCSEPLCAMCIIENQSAPDRHYQHQVEELQKAYQQSLKILKTKNKDLDSKKSNLRSEMQFLVEQMKKLKSNSDDIEERLYKLLTETLSMLQRKFEEKSSLLKNDFAELQRQESEIGFTEQFMMNQAHNCDPVSFLQIWDSYQKHLKSLSRQKTQISDVPIDIKLDTRPLIISGGTNNTGI